MGEISYLANEEEEEEEEDDDDDDENGNIRNDDVDRNYCRIDCDAIWVGMVSHTAYRSGMVGGIRASLVKKKLQSMYTHTLQPTVPHNKKDPRLISNPNFVWITQHDFCSVAYFYHLSRLSIDRPAALSCMDTIEQMPAM